MVPEQHLEHIGRLLLGQLTSARLEPVKVEILRVTKEDRYRRLTVPAGPADLLVGGVERLADRGVEDEPDVGLVDAHSERDRHDDDVVLGGHERVLDRPALAACQAGVVRDGIDVMLAQRGGDRLGLPPGRRVDDAWPGLAWPGPRRGPRSIQASPATHDPFDLDLDVGAVETKPLTLTLTAAPSILRRSTISVRTGGAAVAVRSQIVG